MSDDLPIKEYDVDGYVDSQGVRFIGKAVEDKLGRWVCLANVGGALCLVQVRITKLEAHHG